MRSRLYFFSLLFTSHVVHRVRSPHTQKKAFRGPSITLGITTNPPHTTVAILKSSEQTQVATPFGTLRTLPKTCTVNTRTKTESTYLRHTLYRTDAICPVDERKIYMNKNAKRTQIALHTSGMHTPLWQDSSNYKKQK